MPRRLLPAFLLPLMLSACCEVARRVPGPLPPPITPEEQIARLNARVAALPHLRATTVLRGVELHYPDKKGKDHAENFEGILLMRQRDPGETTAPTAAGRWDVRLVGRAFEQEVMQAGANADNWWFIIRLDQQIALVGDSSRPIDRSRLGSPPPTAANSDAAVGNPLESGILRADLVPELLGLTFLSPVQPFRPVGAVSMLVNDLDGTNDLFILSDPGSSPVSIQREIIVDRRTGDITEVRLFDRNGRVVVRSLLDNYKPIDNAPANVRMPYRMQLDYPSQNVRVLLTIEKMTAPADMSPILTPDFEEQGLKVRRVD